MINKIERIQSLVKELNSYRNEYYNLNKPTVSDLEYDSKFDELSKLEKETNYILSDSPTQTVGYEVKSKLNKRTHPTPLKSLDKTKSIDELNKWRNNKDIILMLKADGLTVELDYENGYFVGGYTRGNGEIGEDISHNCRVFKNIPLTIPFKGKLRVSGEAIIHWNDFDNINSNLSYDEKYATPRNLVAGSVRQLDSKICSQRNVYFYAFNILEYNETLSDSKHDNFHSLYNLGFDVIPLILITQDITRENIDVMKDYAKNNNIPIDGMVISYESVRYSNTLGNTSHHPLHSLAFKEKDETEESVLRSVEWNTTRTGLINPTAIFDTVILDGTEVSRASLHNLSIIEGLQLDIENRILVSKRNLIIPHVEENLDRDDNILSFPSICPACGSKTDININKSITNGKTKITKTLICTNDNCSAKHLDKFINFVKRDAMNIEGLSEATLEKFINKGWLSTFDDIYYLNEHKSDIMRMEGFGQKSYDKLIKSIEKSKNVKLENFIVALGIPQIGKSTSKTIAKYFKNDWFAFETAYVNNFDFTKLEDFGTTMNDNIYQYLSKGEMGWNDLVHEVNFIKEEKKTDNSLKDLTGLTFVITGSVNTFKNRDEFKALVESLNGKVAGGVSSKTNYLVNNDTESTSGKNKTAKELNVNIISEAQFNELIGRSI